MEVFGSLLAVVSMVFKHSGAADAGSVCHVTYPDLVADPGGADEVRERFGAYRERFGGLMVTPAGTAQSRPG